MATFIEEATLAPVDPQSCSNWNLEKTLGTEGEKQQQTQLTLVGGERSHHCTNPTNQNETS